MRFARRSFMPSSLSLAAVQPATAQEPAGSLVHTVTYFELLSAAVSGSASLPRTYAAGSRAAPGNVSCLLLQEIVRPNRFVMIEAWQDRASAEARSSAREGLHETLGPGMIGGFDVQSHSELSMSPAADESGAPIYIVTHLDVFPPGMMRAADLLRAESSAARSDDGNVRFDVLRWDGHPTILRSCPPGLLLRPGVKRMRPAS